MELFVNRPKDLESLSLPRGVTSRCGSEATLPDYLIGRGYHEFGITNETLSGISARARMVKESNGTIAAFAGVGTPVKVAIQAALLQPQDYLGFIDISGQNVFDSLLLVFALRTGHQTVSDFLKTGDGKAMFEELANVMPDKIGVGFKKEDGSYQFGRYEAIRKTPDAIRQIDWDLLKGLEAVSLAAEDCAKEVQRVNQIQVCLESIRSEDVLESVLKSSGLVVIDSSNVPLYSDRLNAATVDPLIFFGFNGDNDAARELQVPEFGYKRTRYGIRYWSYKLNDDRTRNAGLSGGMTVGMGYFKSEYRHIIRKVDSASPQW